VNEWGEIGEVLKSDVSSPHLSPDVRVSCMGAGNDGHYHRYDNGNDGYHHGHYGNYRYHW
jgi:hypothetical protein